MASKGRTSRSNTSAKSHSPTPTNLSASTSRRSAKSRHNKQQGEEKETLAYKVLNADQTKGLSEIDDVDLLQEKVAEVLKITDTVPVELKDGASLDYFVAGLWWGKEQGYNVEQLSAMFTVLHILLENVKEKHLTMVENLREFKKMLVGIGMDPQPDQATGGLDCLDMSQAKALTDYMHISFFQHHKLFEYMFSHTQAEEVIGTDLEVETPKAAELPWPPLLIEGVPEQIHKEFIATPPPTPPPKPGEGEEGEEVGAEGEGADDEELQKEADLLSQLAPEEVKKIMDEVFVEMLSGVKTEVATKLREKENAFINRINKIHKVADI